MTLSSFKDTLQKAHPPASWGAELKALWYVGKDQWQAAHDIVENLGHEGASWVHAHLHRIEGDEWNARYWYRRAGKPFPVISIEEEWELLVNNFLTDQT